MCNMRTIKDAHIGDTLKLKDSKVDALPGRLFINILKVLSAGTICLLTQDSSQFNQWYMLECTHWTSPNTQR